MKTAIGSLWAKKVMQGKKTLDEVPTDYLEEVKERLKELEREDDPIFAENNLEPEQNNV